MTIPPARIVALAVFSGVVVLAVGSAGCGALGYSSRVLHRVPSPDGRLVAVCQEIPEFDGPGYGVRVEDPHGRVQAQVFRGFDADPCDEMVWSADGRALAILTGYRALLRIADVSASLASPPVLEDTRPYAQAFPPSPFVSQSEFSTAVIDRRGWDLRFLSSGHFELSICTHDWESHRQTRRFDCIDAVRTERVAIPQRD